MRLNIKDLAQAVAEESDGDAKEIEKTLRLTFDVLARKLASGESVFFVPNFGSFDTPERAATTKRNPQTGEPISVPARRVVRFRPTGRLKKMVRDGDTTGTIRKSYRKNHTS